MRVPLALLRKLDKEARFFKQSRSETLRGILVSHFTELPEAAPAVGL